MAGRGLWRLVGLGSLLVATCVPVVNVPPRHRDAGSPSADDERHPDGQVISARTEAGSPDGRRPDAAASDMHVDSRAEEAGLPDAATPAPDVSVDSRAGEAGPPDAAAPDAPIDNRAKEAGPPDIAPPDAAPDTAVDTASREDVAPDVSTVDARLPAQCTVPSDCASHVCSLGVCLPPTCSDHTQNGNETDIDCGGSCALKCAGGQKCSSGSDCAGSVCVAGTCQLRATVALDIVVNAGTDDAEEQISKFTVVTDSSDLELDYDLDEQSRQVIGIRFTNVSIPSGATITSSYVQFTSKTSSSRPTSVTIKGQAADDAAAFTTAPNSISTRPTTTASVAWSAIPPWTANVADAASKTPDLTPVLREIFARPGWSSSHALVLILTGDGGDRSAYSFDGRGTAGAPKLHIEYQP